jgi:2-polyprenyl-3-methyl-5-hydroxy-6-metoxy-1,4-benzoquinol methylase
VEGNERMNPEYYDKVHKHTLSNSALVNQTAKRMEHIAQFISSKHEDIPFSVLDAGCGLGLLQNYLPYGTLYTGVDYSLSAISHASKINKSEFRQTYILGDVYNIFYDFGRDVFDFIVMSEILEHIEFRPMWLANAFRKCSQKMIITVPIDMPNEPSHIKPTWTQEDIEDITKLCGKITELHKFGLEPNKETWWLCVVDRE